MFLSNSRASGREGSRPVPLGAAAELVKRRAGSGLRGSIHSSIHSPMSAEASTLQLQHPHSPLLPLLLGATVSESELWGRGQSWTSKGSVTEAPI